MNQTTMSSFHIRRMLVQQPQRMSGYLRYNLVATQSQLLGQELVCRKGEGFVQVFVKEFVAPQLRQVATWVNKSYATTTDRSTGTATGAFLRARNPHDTTAASDSQRDGNRQQTSGRKPDLAQGAKVGCQRGQKYRVPHSPTLETAWVDRRTRPDAHQRRGSLLRKKAGARPHSHGLLALRKNH